MSKTMPDVIGDRMKAHEKVETSRRLDRSMPIYARIDGRAFSQFTSRFRRPFDIRMTSAMIHTTKVLVDRLHANIGYVQSDEISLVWMPDGPDQQMLFGGKVQKLTSITASLATAAFMQALDMYFPDDDTAALLEIKGVKSPVTARQLLDKLPHFDSRVMQLPSKWEAVNMIQWREQDARRNAISMAAQALYSHRQLQKKSSVEMAQMIADKGVDFSAYPTAFQRGTFVRREAVERKLTDAEWTAIPEAHRPDPDMLLVRTTVRELDVPPFNEIENRLEFVFDGADPIRRAEAA